VTVDGTAVGTGLAAAPALIVAGAAKGGFGGAGAFAATPLLALALGPGQALGVMLPLLMAIDVVTLRIYWRRWSPPDARTLMAAGVLGVGLGWALFGLIPPAAVQLAIGTVALLFVAFRALQAVGWTPPGSAAFSPLRAGFWGAVAGLTSFVAHAGGPPTAMALAPRRLDKTAYQASVVATFWWINVVKLGPYFALGLIDAPNLAWSLALAPFAALGVAFGVWGHRRVPQAWFDGVILAALMVTGAKLAYDGAAALM
jgi:uncharacterized membrane protein YfcA